MCREAHRRGGSGRKSSALFSDHVDGRCALAHHAVTHSTCVYIKLEYSSVKETVATRRRDAEPLARKKTKQSSNGPQSRKWLLSFSVHRSIKIRLTFSCRPCVAAWIQPGCRYQSCGREKAFRNSLQVHYISDRQAYIAVHTDLPHDTPSKVHGQFEIQIRLISPVSAATSTCDRLSPWQY